MNIVKKDKPHTLVLMGPFLDQANSDLENGDISYRDPVTNKIEYLDYEQVFFNLMAYIRDELA